MPKQPTDAELAILQVLWELGPSTVREVHNGLLASKEIGYATTVKMLVICLLYTSPSPRDRQKSRMPSSA